MIAKQISLPRGVIRSCHNRMGAVFFAAASGRPVGLSPDFMITILRMDSVGAAPAAPRDDGGMIIVLNS